jgi:hypothetical protein
VAPDVARLAGLGGVVKVNEEATLKEERDALLQQCAHLAPGHQPAPSNQQDQNKKQQQQVQQPADQGRAAATQKSLLAIGQHIQGGSWASWRCSLVTPGMGEWVTAAQLWDFVAKATAHRMSGEQLAGLCAGMQLLHERRAEKHPAQGGWVEAREMMGSGTAVVEKKPCSQVVSAAKRLVSRL